MKKNILKGAVMELVVEGSVDTDLLQMVKAIKKYADKFTLMITVDLSIHDFHERMGRVCTENTGFDKMLNQNILTEDDAELYEFMGKMLLDTYITETYYIKSTVDENVYQIEKVVD